MKLLSIFIVLIALNGSVAAAVLHEQSFEEPSWLGGQYFDTGDPFSSHQLLNNPGEARVDLPDSRVFYHNTRTGIGLTDGDWVGVTDDVGDGVGAYPDGIAGYRMSDTDGQMLLEFDQVAGAAHCSFWLFVQSADWGDDDILHIEHLGNTASTVFLSTWPQGIEELDIEGRWLYFEGEIEAAGNLIFVLDCDSETEAIYIDHVVFTDGGAMANEDRTWGGVKTLYE